MNSFFKNHKFELFSFAVIFFLAVLVYWHCYSFEFVYLDDDILILNRLSELEDLSSAKHLLFSSVFDTIRDKFYRPVLMFSFMTDTLICGGEPGFYHYSNLMWHIVASFLVLLLFRNFEYSEKISFAAAVLFDIHPALTPAVAWIGGRNDILLAVFILLCFIFFIKYRKSGRFFYVLLSAFFFLTALFTKETALLIIPIFILHILIYKAQMNKRSLMYMSLCYLSALTIYVVFRHIVLSAGVQNISIYEIAANIINSFGILFWYFNLSMLTEKATLFYGINGINLFTSLFFLMFYFLFRRECKLKNIVFGLSWFILLLIPTFIAEELFAHRLYLPIIGIFIAVFEIFKSAAEKYAKNKRFLIIIFFVAVSAMSILAYKHSFNYKDRKTFWFKALEDNPQSVRVNKSISDYYRDKGDFDSAEKYALKAFEYDKPKNYSKTFAFLGDFYRIKGDAQKAESYFNKSIECDPLRENGYLGLSMIYEAQKKIQEAKYILIEGLKYIPKSHVMKRRLDLLESGEKDYRIVISMKTKK